MRKCQYFLLGSLEDVPQLTLLHSQSRLELPKYVPVKWGLGCHIHASKYLLQHGRDLPTITILTKTRSSTMAPDVPMKVAKSRPSLMKKANERPKYDNRGLAIATAILN